MWDVRITNRLKGFKKRYVALVSADVSEERRFLQQPYGVTSQKTVLFIVSTTKISVLHFKGFREGIFVSFDALTELSRNVLPIRESSALKIKTLTG
jgi:hypothetical protein